MRALATLIAAGTALSIASYRPVKAHPSQSAQQPVFRAAIDRVRVDVVVTDSSDRPIADLTQADFSIVEKGTPQTITDFRFVSVPVLRREAEAPAIRVPEPDVAGNAMAAPTSRLWAIVVDDLHLIESDIVPIKRVLTDLVRSFPPEDEVAIVYTGRSDTSVNFTTNYARLLGAIDNVRKTVGFGLDANPAAARIDQKLVVATASRSTDVLRNVSASLAGSGHMRRAIVYVGTMTTIDPDGPPGTAFFTEELMPVFEQAKRSDVPIYTIDPRGIVNPEDAVRGGIGAISNESVRATIRHNIRSQQNWTKVIAINTGGRAFTDASDLSRAVAEIVAENGSFYELAFSPNPLLPDGRLHEFDVKVNRPGVRIRARKAYVAPGAKIEAASLQSTVESAISAGVNVVGLTVRATAMPLAAAAKGVNTAVTVELEYPPSLDGSRRIDDTLALSVFALDPDGKVKATSSQHLKFAGTAPNDQPIMLLLDAALELPSQPLTLRVGVASQQLGRAGSVQMPIDVPDPSDAKPQIGGVAIGVVGASPPALNGKSIAPLVPFQPTTSRAFAASDTLRVFGRAFWKSKGAAAVAIGVVGAAVAQTRLTTATGVRGGQEATFDAMLPLRGVPPGTHVIEIVATVSGKTIRRDIPITIR
ncbi:MAG TPA: VWA domain-containing protein [Vicinamibacterales bacterium]|nr:VWA domain-containing protein [Vicinamibacterales bacterium]